MSCQEGVDGYSGTVDTFIHEYDPAGVFGSLPSLEWDLADHGLPKWALLRFDSIFGSGAGQLPIGATIESATLTFEVFNEGDPADAHEVLIDWTEGVTYNTV